MSKFHDKFWYRDGQAKRCYVCISPQVERITVDTIDGHLECEYEEVCRKCKTRLAYWAYGYYYPCWLMSTKEELTGERNGTA